MDFVVRVTCLEGGSCVNTPVGGKFNSSAVIAMVAPGVPQGHPTAAIRYTLDGSEPTTASPAFKDPITIDATTKIAARVFNGTSSSSSAYSFLVTRPTFTRH
jgi:hypothetical protein